ncbi:MAG: SDR family oxidoreductase [Gammaproteobacteria bacterium]|nr:SDR family oxidoreductase [Gammaproteobacteria bacterium]
MLFRYILVAMFRRALLVSLCLLLLAPYASADNHQRAVLITGSNRGIGFEFARQYAELGWLVIATARAPGAADALQALAADNANVVIEQLDVTDLAGVDALAEKYSDQRIDVLLNNAAISGSPSLRQKFGRVDYDYFDDFMATNARGPLKVAEAFLPHVKMSDRRQIVLVSSIGGSFSAGGRDSCGTMIYRASKAAANMLMVNVAEATAMHGVTVTLVNPGLVDTQGMLTEMNEKMKLGLTLVPIKDSVAGMISVIAAATPATSGRFYQWSGEELGY